MLRNFSAVEKAETPANNSNDKKLLTVESIDNHVYFYADVNTDRCLDLIKQLRSIDGILRNEKVSRSIPDHADIPIWLHIQSYGGSLFAGLSMIDQIRSIPSPIYSISEGVCASAATLIALSCEKKFILPNSFLLIHQFSSVMWGTHEEFKDDMYLQERLMERLIDFYADISGMSKDKIKERLKHDYWMNAEKAINEGFIDEIYK